MRTPTNRVAAGLALIAGLTLGLRTRHRTSRAVRRRLDAVGGHLRDLGGRLHGLSYRLRRCQPDPDVADLVLADRVRSSLGPLAKRLDLPHIHVMVDDHVVLLHGEVGTQDDADDIEAAVAAVSGVRGVESYLHVGLIAGDTRPSAGRAVEQPSNARRRLIDAALGAGLDPPQAQIAVRAVLAAFAERLPDTERRQVEAHLPADVQVMFTPPRRRMRQRIRTSSELVDVIVAGTPEFPRDKAQTVTRAIVGELRDVVRDEAAGVAAVLPTELREFWEQASHEAAR